MSPEAGTMTRPYSTRCQGLFISFHPGEFLKDKKKIKVNRWDKQCLTRKTRYLLSPDCCPLQVLCPHPAVHSTNHQMLLMSSFSSQAGVRSLLVRTCLNDLAKWPQPKWKLVYTHMSTISQPFQLAVHSSKPLLMFSPNHRALNLAASIGNPEAS